MRSSKRELVFGMSGIVFVIALFAAFSVAGPRLTTTASAQAVAAYYIQNQRPLQLAQSLRVLASLVFFVFLAGLWALVKQTDAGSGERAAGVLAAGVATPILTLVVIAARLTLTMHAGQIQDAAVVRLVRDFAQVLEMASFYPFAVVVGLGSWTLWGTRGATRWIGLAGVALALLVLVGVVGSLVGIALTGLAMIGLLGCLAWVLAISIVMTLRGAQLLPTNAKEHAI